MCLTYRESKLERLTRQTFIRGSTLLQTPSEALKADQPSEFAKTVSVYPQQSTPGPMVRALVISSCRCPKLALL